MKTSIRSSLILCALIGGLGLFPAGQARGQNFTTLYSFSAVTEETNIVNTVTNYYETNSGGAYPFAGLVLSGNMLYGTAYEGGASGYGTVFAVSTNGGLFSTLHDFTYTTDGGYPENGLVLSGNLLYGTTPEGGRSDEGVLYGVSTDGTVFTNVHGFSVNSNGYFPESSLLLAGNMLYGTTEAAALGSGTVFAVGTNGTGYTVLHRFAEGSYENNTDYEYDYYTNSDGAFPYGGLVLVGGTLYGTTYQGGTWGAGTVFAVNTNGTGFTNLYNFTGGLAGGYPLFGTLAVSGNTLYGTTSDEDSASGYGTVFAINTDGTGFTTLYSFTNGYDGYYPESGVILSGTTLYGTAVEGGSYEEQEGIGYGEGTVFALNTDGTGFTNLYSFDGGTDGGYPAGGLTLSGNTLYGTTYEGGAFGVGTVYSLKVIMVEFTAKPTTGAAPLTVDFSSPSVDNTGNAITSWSWNFGDGATSTLQNPSHTYASAGTYSPSLQATNSNGLLIAESGPSITVSPPTLIVYTANPTVGQVPLTVNFSAPGADAAGDTILRWAWNFGDGKTSAAQNPTHTYTNVGTYYLSFFATNDLGGALTGTGPGSITATNAPVYSGLVLNGNYATGNFNGWTLSGSVTNALDVFVDNGSQSGIAPLSGEAFLTALGPVGSLSYFSQTLATTPGALYQLSFWFDSPDGETPNEFQAFWNGDTMFDETNIPAIGWTNMQYLVTATGPRTLLVFGFRDDPSYLGLANVGVYPAQPGFGGIQLSGTNLVLNGVNGLSGGLYYVLSSTNLALPISQWTPVATNVPGANGNFTITLTNAATSGPGQQYYILEFQ